MKLDTNEKGTIILENVYSGIELKTDDGESMYICMRDSGFEFNYMGAKYEAKKGIVKKRIDYTPNIACVGLLLKAGAPNTNGHMFTKECIVDAVENFNKKNIGEISHIQDENIKLDYFMCSSKVIEQFPEFEHSKPFKSGYNHDNEDIYYIAKIDFNKVSEYYIKNINPFQSFDYNSHFWCEECVEGTMDVSKITISGLKKNGVFHEIENKIGLTKTSNIAMTIANLSKKYNITPIELINKIVKSK